MRRLPSEPEHIRKKRVYEEAQKIQKIWLIVNLSIIGAVIVFTSFLYFKNGHFLETLKYRFNDTDCLIQCIDYDYGNGAYFECEGETLLIDSGSSEHSEELLNFIEDEGIEKLDYFLVSDPNEEYLKVFADVMDSVEITRVVASRCDDSLLSKYDDLTFANVSQLFTADSYSCFTAGDLQFDIFDSESLTARVSFEDNSFLIYNSCSDNTELEMIDSLSYREYDALVSLDGNLPIEKITETVKPKNIIVNRNAVITSNGVKIKVEYENI